MTNKFIVGLNDIPQLPTEELKNVREWVFPIIPSMMEYIARSMGHEICSNTERG